MYYYSFFAWKLCLYFFTYPKMVLHIENWTVILTRVSPSNQKFVFETLFIFDFIKSYKELNDIIMFYILETEILLYTINILEIIMLYWYRKCLHVYSKLVKLSPREFNGILIRKEL
jgi:hypothetical protein